MDRETLRALRHRPLTLRTLRTARSAPGHRGAIADGPLAPLIRLARAAPAFLRLPCVAALLRDLGERSPQPAPELAFAQLLGDPERSPEVVLCLVELAQLAPGVATFTGGVRKLPPSAQVFECGDRGLEAPQ